MNKGESIRSEVSSTRWRRGGGVKGADDGEARDGTDGSSCGLEF